MFMNLGLLNLKEKRGLSVREKGLLCFVTLCIIISLLYSLFLLENSVLFEKLYIYIYIYEGSFENAHKENVSHLIFT